jgi:hypothetical protein
MKKIRETTTPYTASSTLTISVPKEVLEELDEIVRLEGLPAEQVVGKAVIHYYYQVSRQKIDAEAEAFRRKHARLRAKYLGCYIAMHNGRVVDHDRDLSALNRRIRKQFGKTPVLMRLVEAEPERVLVFRSPRLEPIQ